MLSAKADLVQHSVYAILPVTPFAEKRQKSRQLYSAYTDRCVQLIKMKKVIIATLVFLITPLVEGQTDISWFIGYYDSLYEYIDNPDSTDQTCINDISNAKMDILENRIVFCSPIGHYTGLFRAEKELIELVQDYG